MRASRGLIGIALGLAAGLAFGAGGVFVKPLLESGWSPGAAVLARISVAALLLAVPGLVALRFDLRPLWREARLTVFGHALLEQLARPRKGLTAHVWCEPAAAAAGATLDDWLAARCTPGALAAKPFTPLPVLGVPGWWAESENFSFYDDSLVFRPRKTPEPTTTTTSAGPARS